MNVSISQTRKLRLSKVTQLIRFKSRWASFKVCATILGSLIYISFFNSNKNFLIYQIMHKQEKIEGMMALKWKLRIFKMKKNSPLFSEIKMALLNASFLIHIKHTYTQTLHMCICVYTCPHTHRVDASLYCNVLWQYQYEFINTQKHDSFTNMPCNHFVTSSRPLWSFRVWGSSSVTGSIIKPIVWNWKAETAIYEKWKRSEQL